MAKPQRVEVAVIERRERKIKKGKLVVICIKGKTLGKYRKPEFAERDHFKLAVRACTPPNRVGIFRGNNLIGPKMALD